MTLYRIVSNTNYSTSMHIFFQEKNFWSAKWIYVISYHVYFSDLMKFQTRYLFSEINYTTKKKRKQKPLTYLVEKMFYPMTRIDATPTSIIKAILQCNCSKTTGKLRRKLGAHPNTSNILRRCKIYVAIYNLTGLTQH